MRSAIATNNIATSFRLIHWHSLSRFQTDVWKSIRGLAACLLIRDQDSGVWKVHLIYLEHVRQIESVDNDKSVQSLLLNRSLIQLLEITLGLCDAGDK